jgi:CRISPR-associated protein Cmr3
VNEKEKKSNGIFIEHKQIGIRKNYRGKSEDKAFYVQFYYKLKRGYSFAFILEIEDDIKFVTKEIVTIGGEQSKFRMDVSDNKNEFEDMLPLYEGSEQSAKIVLVSDAFVSNDIFKDCDFAITDTIDFRSLQSTVTTTNYSKLNRHGEGNDGVSKSGKYNFFKKGSVFYGENISGITKHFNEKNAARKIGYNYYKIVDKEGK